MNQPRAQSRSRSLPMESLTRILDDERVYAALIDPDTLELIWISEQCRAANLSRRVGDRLDRADPLAGLLDSLSSKTSHARSVRLQSAMFKAQPTDEACPTEPEVEHVDESVAESVSAERICDDRILIRWRNPDRLGAYYRHFMAERERLFSVSHSLTVNEMATTLAHELNQPIGTTLNIINGCRRRLERGDTDPEALCEGLTLASRQSEFAAEIIARIRNFTAARQPAVVAVDIRDVVRDALALLDWVVESERIDVRLNTSNEPLMVRCDRTMLQQVLINLCRNGIEAMRDNADGERRVLGVVVLRSEDGILIDIEDHGHGLGAKGCDALFTPFRTDKPDGMGVGLNICRSFVELHQGRFWLTTNSHRGCTAHILLPEMQSAVSPENDRAEAMP